MTMYHAYISYYMYNMYMYLVHNVHVNLVHIISHVMHNVGMLAQCSHVNLVRIPRRDRMYLACYMYENSRRDHVLRSRSPKRMLRRNRSFLVENLIVMYFI